MARELLSFDRDFQTTRNGSFLNGDVSWFVEGRLNASFNCVDRHAIKDPNKIAIIYEADEPNEGRIITYGELLREVSRVAWTLKQQGVKKGDTVAIYLPMIPEALIAFLACSRIGAVHSVIFAGFSSDSLRDRVVDAGSKVVITTDEGRRGGKAIGTKRIVDEALKQCPEVTSVLVYKRTGAEFPGPRAVTSGGTRRSRSTLTTLLPSPLAPKTLCFCSTLPVRPASPRVSCTPLPVTCSVLP